MQELDFSQGRARARLGCTGRDGELLGNLLGGERGRRLWIKGMNKDKSAATPFCPTVAFRGQHLPLPLGFWIRLFMSNRIGEGGRCTEYSTVIYNTICAAKYDMRTRKTGIAKRVIF